MTTARDEGGSEVVQLPQRTPFTMVDNPIIRAMTDYVALGLYLDMLSYPAGWRINIRELARSHKQGRQVLTDAMNDLIEKGLVFRVRFQESGGQWRTRTYVCSSPVTLAELQQVQEQYRQRCVIETSLTLTAALQPGKLSTGTGGVSGEAASEAPVAETAEVKPLVAPSTRFPAPGEPAVGRPALGNLVPQRPERRRKKPPPPPSAAASPQPGQTTNEEEDQPPPQTETAGAAGAAADAAGSGSSVGAESDTRLAEVERLQAAVAKAWPGLGRRDLSQLRPLIAEALIELPARELREHLTSNTGGALRPMSVLRSRLGNLPEPPKVRALPAWCGDCTSPSYRWLQDDDGQPVSPCPRCSPQAQQRRANPDPGRAGAG